MISDILGVFPRHVTLETTPCSLLFLFATVCLEFQNRTNGQDSLHQPTTFVVWPMKKGQGFKYRFRIIWRVLYHYNPPPNLLCIKKKFHHKVVRIEITYQYPSVLILDIRPISAIRTISGIRLGKVWRAVVCVEVAEEWPGSLARTQGKGAAALRTLHWVSQKGDLREDIGITAISATSEDTDNRHTCTCMLCVHTRALALSTDRV